jgi:hypothetical protein
MDARLVLTVAGLALGACRTVEGPEGVAAAYAQAVRSQRLEEAYGLTTTEYRARVTAEAFKAQYQDEQRRRERADAIESGLAKMSARSTELEAVRENDGWRVAELAPGEGPKEALARFLDAADAGDFASAYGMLSGSWRARYTPALFAKDFAAEPLAKERLARARAGLSASVVWSEDQAQLPLGGGKAVRLVREGGVFRVAALE